MIDLMMNEKQYIENVIRFGTINPDYPARDVNMLVRYCFHEFGMRRSRIISYIDEFMYKHYAKDYNPFEWHPLVERYVRKASGKKLIEINSVPITKSEIDTISNANNLEAEKLLFTMLVIAKYKCIAYKANGWVSESRDELFRTANCKTKVNDRNSLIHTLFVDGFLELSRSNKKENWRVPFIDDESEVVLNVTTTVDCGLRYRKYIGDDQIIECVDCGKLFVQPKPNLHMIRCNNCQRIHDNNTRNVIRRVYKTSNEQS